MTRPTGSRPLSRPFGAPSPTRGEGDSRQVDVGRQVHLDKFCPSSGLFRRSSRRFRWNAGQFGRSASLLGWNASRFGWSAGLFRWSVSLFGRSAGLFRWRLDKFCPSSGLFGRHSGLFARRAGLFGWSTDLLPGRPAFSRRAYACPPSRVGRGPAVPPGRGGFAVRVAIQACWRSHVQEHPDAVQLRPAGDE